MRNTKTQIGLALALALTGLAGAGLAQESAANGFNDLTPPDMSAPRSSREYRTCPDREAQPAWIEEVEGWEAVRGGLVQEMYKARSYEQIVATGDCSCAVKAPSWDAAETEYQENYAPLDLGGVSDALTEFQMLSSSLRRDARRICQEQNNW